MVHHKFPVIFSYGAICFLVSGISQVNALSQALESSNLALEATQAGFEVGTRTSVDVLISLRETYRTQRDYAAARYQYLLDDAASPGQREYLYFPRKTVRRLPEFSELSLPESAFRGFSGSFCAHTLPGVRIRYPSESTFASSRPGRRPR